MSFLFRIIFSCCIRSGSSSKQTIPDENSRLIPVLIDPSISDPTSSLHGQQVDTSEQEQQMFIQERLGGIVRTTQGKMVNVNAHLPFNLHNQKLPPRSLDPSSSRSQSLNGYRPPRGGLGDNIGPGPGSSILVFDNSRLNDGASPGPSLHSDAEYSSGGDEAAHLRKPLLDIRLVTDAELSAEKSGPASGRSSQRGRARVREDLDAIAASSQNNDHGEGWNPVGNGELPKNPGSRSQSRDSHSSNPAPPPPPPPANNFKLKDSGNLLVDWD